MAKLARVTGVQASLLKDGIIFVAIGIKVDNVACTEVYAMSQVEGDTFKVDACERWKISPRQPVAKISGRRLLKLKVPGGRGVKKVHVRGSNGVFESLVQ